MPMRAKDWSMSASRASGGISSMARLIVRHSLRGSASRSSGCHISAPLGIVTSALPHCERGVSSYLSWIA